jgi:hypothetical protein
VGAFYNRFGGVRHEFGAREDPRAFAQRVTSVDLAGFGRQPQRFRRNIQNVRGVREIEPGLDAVGCGFEYRNAMVRSQRGDALAAPTIAVTGFETVAIENASDQIVVGDQCQLAYGRDDISWSAVALSAPAPGQADLTVNAA